MSVNFTLNLVGNFFEDFNMLKLLGIAALVAAFMPFAYAQNGSAALAGHPDARNDRPAAVSAQVTVGHKMIMQDVGHGKRHHKAQLAK